jgi:hypothetical protein
MLTLDRSPIDNRPRIAGRRRSGRTIIALLVAACSLGGDKPSAGRSDAPLIPKQRDSAGVRILEHPADALDRAPLITLDTVPIATIGQGAADLDLSQAYSRMILGDGSIVFFASGAVHVYSPDGASNRRIGRDGDGPGEFRRGELAWGRGDTILVTDPNNARISWVVPSSGVVRTRSVTLGRPGGGYGAIAQWDGDTLIMGTVDYYPQATADGSGVPMPVGVLSPAHDSIRVLAHLTGLQMRSVPGAAGADLEGPAAVRYSPMPATGSWGDGVLASNSDRWHLDRYRPAGGLAFSVRIPQPRVPMTKELKDRDVAATIALFKQRPDPPPDTSSFFRRLPHLPYPDSLPAFAEVWTTPGGIAWVRDARLRSDTTWAYTAVDSSGAIVGRLLGTGKAPIAFGTDRALIPREDADGVVTWRVFRVTLPAPRR